MRRVKNSRPVKFSIIDKNKNALATFTLLLRKKDLFTTAISCIGEYHIFIFIFLTPWDKETLALVENEKTGFIQYMDSFHVTHESL